MESILLLIFGVGFIAFGIRHNKNTHKEEGFGPSGSVILEFITSWTDKLPYWFSKSIYLLIGLGYLIGMNATFIAKNFLEISQILTKGLDKFFFLIFVFLSEHRFEKELHLLLHYFSSPIRYKQIRSTPFH